MVATKQVLIIGGGFAGLNAARALGKAPEVAVTLVDKQNHHLFQPLLYQVAMAGLSPADIAVPIRTILSRYRNTWVLHGEVTSIDLAAGTATADFGPLTYDYLILCCGVRHSYFGHEEWEEFAPGLKTVEQATEIRRRVLTAFEVAERVSDAETRRKQLTFVIVGGGPTGVELAGAIGEMSRFTLAKDFRSIDATLTRVILLESGPRILSMFSPELASRATRDLEQLGVQVWTSSMVTKVDADGVQIGDERLKAATVLWAAGVAAPSLGRRLGVPCDRQGRVIVAEDLSIPGFANAFVVGDQAHFAHQGEPLPGTAPVAIQQGRFVAANILRELRGRPRQKFRFSDKGRMATIGRSRAIAEIGRLKLKGLIAWLAWLVVHIYYLTGFKNRLFVVMQWAWSFISFRRGARLIVNKEWRFGREPAREPAQKAEKPTSERPVSAG